MQRELRLRKLLGLVSAQTLSDQVKLVVLVYPLVEYVGVLTRSMKRVALIH
jgi:hypothetical protein